MTCKSCDKKVEENKKFCSHVCHGDFRYKEFIKRWLAGQENGLRGHLGVSEHIRRYLRGISKNKCMECGWKRINQTTGLVPLEINHKDGNHKNNKPENLELICPNCHSLTDNFKALNKGNGRKNR